ncbi:FAD-dependent oxidoreductase [Pseudooceanicola sediminis]|uniref:FAD-dependent oxidoreductase n=1 Tax=Pseudooceanicola sediminis TaxID=2211117 RepID=A0A399IXE2_9RHOB|nr:FAD-binding oxidoreductase [Pseudooceanicola sediminis]KAA2313176.1 FAD-dependent oxidoreductase [Puniceibacterium sp. HSS470]RII37823.1 FAD-dependent oxidoreductase [Pseudooceanicola sediminis]|tara:strand:- start:35466 stop:36770 length:1305 start_codon:yes stop_codon:yes gene_type:complete
MKLLYANDATGAYPPSWYAATATLLPPFPPLEGDARADVAIVGGGYTGLSAALHAAQAGLSVILLEAQRVGFGASGRNGGQLGSGQRPYQDDLEKWLGAEDAGTLWQLGEDAKNLVKSLIRDHDIDADLKPGVAWVGCSAGDAKHLHDYADLLQDRYGYTQMERLDAAASHALCPSPAYAGGILDHGAAHLHPLRFALGLARAATAAGVRICEASEVLSLDEGQPATLHTAQGRVVADHVILAGNGYMTRLHREPSRRVMPINNFIAVTEPLGDDVDRVLTRDVAVADSKFVVNYFRLTPDHRLLFGGGESYGYRFPDDIAAKVRAPMTQIFPHLKDVAIDYAWGGTLGITMKRAPFLARLSPNILTASGYSGHGLGTATHAGQLMALAIQGQAAGFDTMSKMPAPPFPGGPAMRSPLLVLAMTWFAIRDRLGL